jgi:3-oxoacyl-[acyl-carrier protein] reductase
VTGAGRGIGRATALALAQAGVNVAVAVSRDLEAAERVAGEAREAGVQAFAQRVDVREREAVEALVQAAMERFGSLDVMINNAGVTRDTLLLRMDEDAWDEVLDVNLKGVFHGTRAALRPMLKQRAGRIVNVSSILGLTGNPGQANYCAAKAGILGLTRATAKEVASRGITVNAVAPGYIQTQMTEKLPAAATEELLKRIPMGRQGTPEEVAAAILFLCSEAASYMTGQVLVLDGGMTA